VNQNPNITITMPLDMVNLCLEALGELPAKRTFDAIVMLRGTAQQQIQAAQQLDAASAMLNPAPEPVAAPAEAQGDAA
jgi:hypothetical protein